MSKLFTGKEASIPTDTLKNRYGGRMKERGIEAAIKS